MQATTGTAVATLPLPDLLFGDGGAFEGALPDFLPDLSLGELFGEFFGEFLGDELGDAAGVDFFSPFFRL